MNTPPEQNEIAENPPEARPSGAGINSLLDRAPAAEYLREWTKRVAAVESATEAGTRSVLIFRIGIEWLALPTQLVREVAETTGIHGIPHHRGGVLLGLTGVRGSLVLCVSLAAVLELEDASSNEEYSAARRLLIIRSPQGALAFPVDEVYGVHRYHPRELQEVPATLSNATSHYARGLLSWQGKTVGCLNDELLLHTLNKGLL